MDSYAYSCSAYPEGLLAVAAGLAVAVTVSASGVGAATAQHTGSAHKYCYAVIARIHPPAPASHVIAHGCSISAVGAAQERAVLIARQDVPLVTFYENADYAGNADTIYGHDGPCDSSGYGISDLTYENNWVIGGISSYTTSNLCSGQKY